MTHEFMPGDRAILINTGEQYEDMRGQVVTIKSPLRAMPTHIGRMMVHEVQPDEIPRGWTTMYSWSRRNCSDHCAGPGRMSPATGT